MGLKNTIQGLVTTAFDVVGDLKTGVNFHFLISDGTYDPVADTETSTVATVTNVQVIFSNFDFNELDSSVIVETDMKMLVDASKLQGNTFSPTNTATEVVSAKKWNVIKILSPPGNSIYILHVRKV